MQKFYVRIWNEAGTRMFGWLGRKDGWAACIPAGLYSNPLSTLGAAVTSFERDPADAGRIKLSIEEKNGSLWLGGKGGGGVSGYWWGEEDKDDCYWVSVVSKGPLPLPLPLPSPVSGTLAGVVAHYSDDTPRYLSAWYTANNDVFGLAYLEDGEDLGSIFHSGNVELGFQTDVLVFEFVEVEKFSSARYDYVPQIHMTHPGITMLRMDNWMGDLKSIIGQRALADLVIPGSHDAMSVHFPEKTQNERSRTQSRSIYEQLRHGTRYLDFRLNIESGVWWGVHGSDRTEMKLDTALNDIKRFIGEHPQEIVLISALAGSENLACWDALIDGLGEHIYPKFFHDENGVEKKLEIKHMSQNGILSLGKNIVLFSWGRPPEGKVTTQGAMKDARRDYLVWAATREEAPVSDGAEPWKDAFIEARAKGYELDFDLAGVWLNSYSTTAHDLRLIADAVKPPSGGPLWALHTGVPAWWEGKPRYESIEDKARRVQPPLAKLVSEDPSMTDKLNVVNIDFAGDNDLAEALVRANLLR